ncbi:MAG: Flp pilus assembly protein CpaB [Dehalococcoidia bacterium]|jgi:pilus assembly protein CpaB
MLALISAALSALLVYVAISRSTGTKATESSEVTASTVVAVMEIPARTQITAQMVAVRDVPLSVRATTALSSVDDAVGKVARYPISVDEQVTTPKVVSLTGPETKDSLAFVVPQGMRAVSVTADQVLSAGGLILPGDYVDVMSVIKGKTTAGDEVDAYVVRTLLQNVQVLAVAQTLADVSATGGGGSTSSSGSGSKPNPEATTLTLLVSPEQAEWVFLAESNGTLRAIVRAFGDADVTQVRPIYQTELYPAGAPPGGG